MTRPSSTWLAIAGDWRRGNAARLRMTGLFLAVPVAAWFVGWLVVGDNLLPIRWGAYGANVLAGLAALAAVLLLLGLRRWWALGAAVLGLLVVVPELPRLAPSRWFRTAAPGDLRVMTFNVSAANTDFAHIARTIGHERPDIVFLQQTRDIRLLLVALRARPDLPSYTSYPKENADTIILSRFALSEEQFSFGITSAVAATRPCPIRILDLHAPHGQYGADEQEAFFERAAQAVSGETRPVIAGGDLNSTEFNSVQAPLRDQLSDAFAQAGAGFGFTFPSDVRRFGMLGRLFRIDHIFFRRETVTAAWTVGDSGNSDHFPVVATFRLNGACR